MVSMTFDLFLTQTVIADIISAFLVVTTPHTLLFGITAEGTVVALAVLYEFAVVLTSDTNGVTTDFFGTTCTANIKVTFVTTVEV